jgi:hypothetical protein
MGVPLLQSTSELIELAVYQASASCEHHQSRVYLQQPDPATLAERVVRNLSFAEGTNDTTVPGRGNRGGPDPVTVAGLVENLYQVGILYHGGTTRVWR